MAKIVVGRSPRGIIVYPDDIPIAFAGIFPDNMAVVLIIEGKQLEFYYGKPGLALARSSIVNRLRTSFGLKVTTKQGHSLNIPLGGHKKASLGDGVIDLYKIDEGLLAQMGANA